MLNFPLLGRSVAIAHGRGAKSVATGALISAKARVLAATSAKDIGLGLVARFVPGAIRLRHLYKFNRDGRGDLPFFWQNFSETNEHGIDLSGRVGVIFGVIDGTEEPRLQRLRLSVDHYRYEEPYTILLNLNGKKERRISSDDCQGFIYFDISDEIQTYLALEVCAYEGYVDSETVDKPTFHISSILVE